jgi:adenine deaminase
MRVLIREGSVSKDLHALAGLLTERFSPYLCLCTDDRNPLDIGEHGHLDYMIRTAIALGRRRWRSTGRRRFRRQRRSG